MRRKRVGVRIEEAMLRKLDEAAHAAAVSRNQFIVHAVARQLREREEERLDREFEAMGRDPERRAMVMAMERELAPASDALFGAMYLADAYDD
jgi:uncharacterized protein (DUF1778 family)